MRLIISAFLFLIPSLLLLNGLWTAVLLPMAVVGLLVAVPKDLWKNAMRTRRKAFIVAAALLVWPLLSILWSMQPMSSASSLAGIAAVIGLCLVGGGLVRQLTPLQWQAFIRYENSLVSGVLFCAANFLIDRWLGAGLFHFITALGGKPFDIFIAASANRGIAACAILAWPLCYSLCLHGKHRSAFSVLLLIGLMVFSAESLSAIMGFSIAAVVFLVLRFAPVCMRWLIIAGLPLFFLVWPLAFHVWSTPQNLASAMAMESLPASCKHRLHIWNYAIEQWSQHPMAGNGMNTSRFTPGANAEFAPGMANLPMHTHNHVIQILLELGAIGVVCWSLGWFLLLRNSLRVDQSALRRAAIGATACGYAIVGMTGFSVWQSWWVATAALAYLYLQWDERTRQQPSNTL